MTWMAMCEMVDRAVNELKARSRPVTPKGVTRMVAAAQAATLRDRIADLARRVEALTAGPRSPQGAKREYAHFLSPDGRTIHVLRLSSRSELRFALPEPYFGGSLSDAERRRLADEARELCRLVDLPQSSGGVRQRAQGRLAEIERLLHVERRKQGRA